MTYVRSFLGYTPPARADATPFTAVRIEEADAFDGTYTTIETIALEPVDEDPAAPTARDLTTEAATLDPAFYRLTWVDADEDTAVGAIVYLAGAGGTWRPTVDEVATYIRARTKDSGGNRAGTFNAGTEPTGEEVEVLIGQAVDHVAATIGGTPCNGALQRQARAAAALYAAILVEVSYFPDSTNNNQSSARQLESLFDKRVKALADAVAEQCEGQGTGGGEDGGNSGALAAGHFSDGEYLIGRDWPEAW